MIFNMSGGGSGLKIKVVAYDSFPQSAKEGTIGVLTTTSISGYVISVEMPGGSEGLVWIKTSNRSTTPISVNSKGTVFVYPVAAKQYISGAWVDKEAKAYHSGAWRYWYLYAVENGTTEYEWSGTRGYMRTGRFELGKSSEGNNCCFCCGEGIDVSEYTKLWIDVERPSEAGGTFSWGLSSTYTQSVAPASLSFDLAMSNSYPGKGQRATYSVDISAVNQIAYIGTKHIGGSGDIKHTYVYSMWLEG